MPSRKGTPKLIMMSATSLLPSMPSVMSGYTRQMTPSNKLLVAQNTLVTTSAPRVLIVNAVRTSHKTTNILKVWGWAHSLSLLQVRSKRLEQSQTRTPGSSTSHYFPFFSGIRTPNSPCLESQSRDHHLNFILLNGINVSARPGVCSPSTFMSGIPFLISAISMLCTSTSHYLCNINVDRCISDSSFLKRTVVLSDTA